MVVSAIGGAPTLGTVGRGGADAPARLLTDAAAQGLVRFDAAGQIEAGLAERWTVLDDGMTYIFRLAPAAWADGRPVAAAQVAQLLRRRLGRGGRGPLAPFLTAVAGVAVMTPQVIEVRLSRPRPDLLKLFAQPELALLRPAPALGSGPMRVVAGAGTAALLLRPAVPATGDPDEPRRRRPEEDVRLLAERAGLAVARFAAHRSDLVAGGTLDDWPLVAAAGVAPANVRVDPAAGLFGFAVTSRDGFLADPADRRAVAEAVDAAALVAALGAGQVADDAILPDGGDAGAAPARPAWAALASADRLADARARVRAWPGGAVALRVALPPGPGGTLLYGALAAGLARAGIATTRVAPDAPAELRLVDSVAPYDSARWYLATACQPCGPAAQAALDAARDAPTLAERAARLAEADRALADDAAFIPVARPLRWSLVALRLRRWQPNARAAHPLNRLRADPS